MLEVIKRLFFPVLDKFTGFVKWLFYGNDKNHVKRAVLFALVLSLMTAVGLLGWYIHASNARHFYLGVGYTNGAKK